MFTPAQTNFASFEAMRISQHSASSKARRAGWHQPFTAAITGMRSRAMRSSTRANSPLHAARLCALRRFLLFRSSPPQNALPRPVSTSVRTSVSRSRLSSAAFIAVCCPAHSPADCRSPAGQRVRPARGGEFRPKPSFPNLSQHAPVCWYRAAFRTATRAQHYLIAKVRGAYRYASFGNFGGGNGVVYRRGCWCGDHGRLRSERSRVAKRHVEPDDRRTSHAVRCEHSG